MPPIPALPALPPNLADAPVAMVASLSSSPSGDPRFGDALFALLAPESAPTLSMDDARALGWRGFALALTPGGMERAPGLRDAKDAAGDADDAAEDASMAGVDLFASLGLPGLVIPVATPEAAPLGDAFGDGGGLAAAGSGSGSAALGLMAALQTEGATDKTPVDAIVRDAAPVEFAEVHKAAMGVDSTAVTEPAKLSLDAPLGSSEFRHQTADAMRWMVRNQETHAEIRIEPPDLGPIQIELKIAREGTEVVFVAAHPDTRDALQDQLPELRDLLAESGIQLTDASVRDEAGSQAPGDTQAPVFAGESEASATAPIARAPLGLIDTFA